MEEGVDEGEEEEEKGGHSALVAGPLPQPSLLPGLNLLVLKPSRPLVTGVCLMVCPWVL